MFMLKLSNPIRILLAIAGTILIVLGVFSRVNILTSLPMLGHPVSILLGISLFLLGLYSPTRGFRDLNRNFQDPVGDTPGCSIGKIQQPINGVDDFGGGDGFSGGD